MPNFQSTHIWNGYINIYLYVYTFDHAFGDYFQIDERVEESEGDGGRCKVWFEKNYAQSLSYEEWKDIVWT